ncbi:hypothetical protein CTAYLR_008088, partial [Chrysophaeum taylorii]
TSLLPSYLTAANVIFASACDEEESVERYISEMRASREELLTKIQRSSEDIAGRCREAMESARDNVSQLFDDGERERVVAAYAEKLKASREETLRKLEERQTAERETMIKDLKADVATIMESVVDKLKREIDRATQAQREEADRQRQAELDRLVEEQREEMKRFHDSAVASLKAAMADHRAGAMRKYNEEMAKFRDAQLQELSKISLDDLARLDDLGEDDDDDDDLLLPDADVKRTPSRHYLDDTNDASLLTDGTTSLRRGGRSAGR